MLWYKARDRGPQLCQDLPIDWSRAMGWVWLAIAAVGAMSLPAVATCPAVVQAGGKPPSKPAAPATIDDVEIGSVVDLTLASGGSVRGALTGRDDASVSLRIAPRPGSKLVPATVRYDRSIVTGFKFIEGPAASGPLSGAPPSNAEVEKKPRSPEEERAAAARTEKVLRDQQQKYLDAMKRVGERIRELQGQIAATTARRLVIDGELVGLAAEERSIAADLPRAKAALALAQAQQRFERETIGRSQPITDAEVAAHSAAVRDLERRRSAVLASMGRLVDEGDRGRANIARWHKQIENFEVDVRLNQERAEAIATSLVAARSRSGGAVEATPAAAASDRTTNRVTGDPGRDASLAAAYAALPPRERVLRDAVVLVLVKRLRGLGYGSGFVATSGGWVVTNAHVVEGALGDVVVAWDTLVDRPTMSMQVHAIDQEHDLALLAPTAPYPAPAPLKLKEALDLGRELFAVGFPLGITLGAEQETSLRDITMSSGTLSGVLRSEANGAPEWLRHDCRANSGASGGPLVDRETLDVVGIVTLARHMRREEGEAGDAIQLAIPSRFVIALLQRAGAADGGGHRK